MQSMDLRLAMPPWLRYAVAPGLRGAKFAVLSPVEFMHIRENSLHPMTYDDVFEKTGWKTVGFLVKAADEIEERAPDLSVTPVLLEGRPKDVILDEAEKWFPDLIVVGSHGYGKVRRIFLGSVSLAIALNASCSVEIVRCPESPLCPESP